MPRRKRRKTQHGHSARIIQRAWRRTAPSRECALLCEYVPRDLRICISGITFNRVSLLRYIQRTGDGLHPFTRKPYEFMTLRALGTNRTRIRRWRQRYLAAMEARESMHRIICDEFLEIVRIGQYSFGTFIIFIQGYIRLLDEQEEDVQHYIQNVYREIHTRAVRDGSDVASLCIRIARVILGMNTHI